MSAATVLVTLVIALGLFFAVRSIIRHRGSGCSGCCGDCSACRKRK